MKTHFSHVSIMSTCRDVRKVYYTSITAAILDFFKILPVTQVRKKWNPIFFSSRSYSEPESVAKSILTNQKSEITNGPALFLTRRNVETIATAVYPRLSFLPVALHCEIYCEYGTLQFDKQTNKQTNK